MTEKALAVSPASLAAAGRLGRWDRVYLGSSFCPGLLPSAGDLGLALAAGAKAVTLATPLMTGSELAAFLPELGRMLRLAPGLELSLCDLGLMEAARRRFGRRLALSLGRPVSHDFIRMEAGALDRFMREHGFRWLETDEPDMVRNLGAGRPFAAAFHYPFAYRAMSRLCPRTSRPPAGCRRPCAGRASPLCGPGEKLDMFENGYFVRNRPFRGGPVRRLVETFSLKAG